MPKPPSPRSLSVKVIALLFILGGISTAFSLFSTAADFSVLGVFGISGWVAQLHHVLRPILILAIGVGLWCLRELARRVAIGFMVLLTLRPILLIITAPGNVRVDTNALNLLGDAAETFVRLTYMLTGAIHVILIGVVIIFLIKRKSAFAKTPTTPQA